MPSKMTRNTATQEQKAIPALLHNLYTIFKIMEAFT